LAISTFEKYSSLKNFKLALLLHFVIGHNFALKTDAGTALGGGAQIKLKPVGTAINRTGLDQLYRFPMTGKTITLIFTVNPK